MIVRRSAAVLAAIAVIGAAAAPAAVAGSPSPSAPPSLPSGLYGTTDPTYDGVWRQSFALFAQHTVGVRPAVEAVDWLAGQQCADGAFAPYRANPTAKCDAKTPVDTNSTAAAVQALAALGGHAQAEKAVDWLKSVQNADGGWSYTPGGASDANSTSVVVGALAAVGEKPGEVRSKGGKSPFEALLKLSIPCDQDGGGAFAYQPDKKGGLAANADATAAAVVGALGQGLAGRAAKPSGTAASCQTAESPEQAARNGAAFLVKALAKDDHLTSALPGAKPGPDYGNTADAVVALATQGSTESARKTYAWLEKNSAQWAKTSGPAAYAQLILAAHALGADPHDFGGADLVTELGATGPAPQAAQATGHSDETGRKTDSSSSTGFWWVIGVGLVAGVGIGFLLSGRSKKRQP